MLTLPLALILASSPAQIPQPTPAQAGLVAADYAFADQVEKEGMRAGFLGALRSDATVFIPRAVNGVGFYKTQLELGAKLKYYPVVTEVAQSNDFGFTTGPFNYRFSEDAANASLGWFVTLWQREGNAPWKIRLEIGIPTPTPDPAEERPVPAPLPRVSAPALPAAAAGQGNNAELMDFDRTFSKDAAKDATAAYKARISDNVRFYRKGRYPVIGAKSLGVALDPGTVTWEPTEAFVSASGDLGCTRGTLQHQDAEGKTSSNYVRMWKKQGSAWKLVLDLELALPKAK